MEINLKDLIDSIKYLSAEVEYLKSENNRLKIMTGSGQVVERTKNETFLNCNTELLSSVILNRI